MRTFFKALATIVIVLIIAIVIIVFVGWSRVPDILANSLSKKMKVSVEIDDIHITSRSIEIDKVEIGNPKGSILPKAFSSDVILIKVPLMKFLDRHIVIDEIDVNNVYLGLEFEYMGSKNGNWSTIMSNMKSSTPSDQKNTNPRTVLIKKLILTNINIDLVYEKGGGKVQKLTPIDRLEFNDISSEGGFPTDQISRIIINQMLRSIFKLENLQDMLENILESPTKGSLQNFLNPLKGIFNMEYIPEESDVA